MFDWHVLGRLLAFVQLLLQGCSLLMSGSMSAANLRDLENLYSEGKLHLLEDSSAVSARQSGDGL